MSARHLAMRILLVLLLAALTLSAQCPLGWADGFAVMGASTVSALSVVDDGSGPVLFAGGLSVHRWNGSTWSGPFGPWVNALVAFDDGSGPALFAGGSFTSVGGVPAAGIAKFQGGAWSALGAGVNGIVSSLSVADDGSGPALYVGGTFATAGGIVANGIARWTGAGWSALGGGVGGPAFDVKAVTVFDDGGGPAIHAAGSFSSAGGVAASNIARWNGVAWSPLGAGTDSQIDALAVFDDGTGARLVAGGWFTSAGGVAAQAVASWNGLAWSPLAAGLGGSQPRVHALAVLDAGAGPRLYAGGNFVGAGTTTASALARWDGSAWSGTGAGGPGVSFLSVNALAVTSDSLGAGLFVGGSLASASIAGMGRVVRFDGAAWSALGGGLRGVPWGTGLAVSAHDDGTGPSAFVGGRFEGAGGVASPNVARWSGTAWTAVGMGLGPSEVLAFGVFDGGGGADLYAGGGAFSVGGATTTGVVRWNGATWSAVGGGVGGPFPRVGCFAVFDDGVAPALYAGGSFTTAGVVPANRVARWDGTSWAAVGMGFDQNDVRALAVLDDGTGPALYAGGSFLTAGGAAVLGVARWSGTAWMPLGAGLSLPNQAVEALQVFDDGNGPALYAGGTFIFSGATAVSHIARWDGAAWQPVGGGSLTGPVFSMTVFDDGTGPALYAGGLFNDMGGVAVANVARWDGSSWTALGSGVAGSVSALRGFQGDLYATGTFAEAGGRSSHGIARWGRRRPALTLAQPLGPGGGVWATNTQLIVGNEYFNFVSFDLCPSGPGSGPYAGLCVNLASAASVNLALTQITAPVGSPPFHFIATSEATSFGPYALPAGLTMEVVCVDFTSGMWSCASVVQRFSVL